MNTNLRRLMIYSCLVYAATEVATVARADAPYVQHLNGDLDEEAINKRIAEFSPVQCVTEKAPPFLFIHGDADFMVPLQQSKVMVAALKKANVSAELIVKQGGGHPWPTIHEEVQVMADWFDKTLDEDSGSND